MAATDVLLKDAYAGDFSFDGGVDDNDLIAFLNNYNNTPTPLGGLDTGLGFPAAAAGSAATAEPASPVLLGTGIVGLLMRRRK